MKRRRGGFSLIELLIIVVIIGVLAALLMSAMSSLRRKEQIREWRSCASNLRLVAIGMMQYTMEYDERMPPVKTNDAHPVESRTMYDFWPYGWANNVAVYERSVVVFQCPTEPQAALVGSNPTKSGYTDYWFNSNLSNLKLQHIASPSRTLMLGDGNDGTELTDARYSLNTLPQAWRDTEGSPARRHLDVANYLFADGHVKALKPPAISNLPVRQSKSTFSVR